MPGPIVRDYKNGSIVYFEKDKTEDIYVLQKGRVVLTYTSIHGTEIKEDVKIGEFFGVKSSIGKYPREETAQVIGNATILVFKSQEFEKFVSDKPHLIIKMLKVFSSQLRSVHKQTREVLGQGESKSPAFELMNVAEVFHRNSQLDHAGYAYRKYLETYPSGFYEERAKNLLELTKQGEAYPISIPELPYRNESPAKNQSEMNEMLHTMAHTKSESAVDPNSLQARYDKGTIFLNAGKIKEAIQIFQEVSSVPEVKSQDEEQIKENSLFYLGKAQFKGSDFGGAVQTFSAYLKKFPTGHLTKENLYHLAIVHEELGEKDKAKQFFQRVIKLPPFDDSLSEDSKSRLEYEG